MSFIYMFCTPTHVSVSTRMMRLKAPVILFMTNKLIKIVLYDLILNLFTAPASQSTIKKNPSSALCGGRRCEYFLSHVFKPKTAAEQNRMAEKMDHSQEPEVLFEHRICPQAALMGLAAAVDCTAAQSRTER